MQSCVHSFFFFFFCATDRPTHLHERKGDGKRNILWGWPKTWFDYFWKSDISRLGPIKRLEIEYLPKMVNALLVV